MTFTVIHGHPNEDEEDNQMSLMVMQFGQFLGRIYLLLMFFSQLNDFRYLYQSKKKQLNLLNANNLLVGHKKFKTSTISKSILV